MEHTPELEETEVYLQSMDFAHAWMLGLILPKKYTGLMGRVNSPTRIKDITSALDEHNHSLFHSLTQKVVNRILEIELQRGDSETQVTRLAEELHRVYGAETLIRILQAFGKDTFIRDSYNWRNTKRGVLSSLLHACYPSTDDDSDTLKSLPIKPISAIYDWWKLPCSPRNGWNSPKKRPDGKDWKAPLTTSMPIPANVSTDKKKAIIARYTPIAIEDLQEGAFDIDWFKEAYKTIGKERFEVVYNAAKYISLSNTHTRARKFADAVNGKTKAADAKKEIIAKRNKDLLMSYGLSRWDEKRQGIARTLSVPAKVPERKQGIWCTETGK